MGEGPDFSTLAYRNLVLSLLFCIVAKDMSGYWEQGVIYFLAVAFSVRSIFYHAHTIRGRG